MADPQYWLNPEQQVEQQALARRQAMAQAMMQQAMEPSALAGGALPSGQMFMPRTSWLEPVSKLVQAYAANRAQKEAEEQQKALARQAQAERTADTQSIVQALEGREAIPAPSDEAGGGPGYPAVPGSVDAAVKAMLAARDPGMQDMGMKLMLNRAAPKAEDSPWAKINPKEYTPESLAAFASSRNPADLRAAGGEAGKKTRDDVHIGGGMWQTYAVSPSGDVDLNAPIGKPFSKRPTASTVTATANAVVPKADAKYAEERMQERAKAMAGLDKAAETAVKANRALDRFLEASKTGRQGGAAPLVSSVQNFLTTFGFPASGLKDVRQMEQAIGDILGSKMQELGARGLTDRDMDVLRQALPRMDTDRAARENVVGILKKANDFTVQEWEAQRGEEQRIYPELSTRIPEPAWYRGYRQAAPAGPSLDDLLKKY